MSSAISSLLSTASVAAANSSSTSAAAAQRVLPPIHPEVAPEPYTVKLTETQQVVQLYNQGQEVSQIADSLSITVGEVNTYLGIADSGG